MKKPWGVLFLLFFASMGIAQEVVPFQMVNEQAVKDVASGGRTTASAAWWGFNPEDSTECLQAAINSKAKTVFIPYMGMPWIVRPIQLHGNQEIILEPGVLILAKKGEFKGKNDSLFSAVDVENLTMRGYGATLRMNKKDYQKPPYEKAEWRMGISVHGGKNLLVEGLTIESTGGDGIYFSRGKKYISVENAIIRNVVCHDNHRQGISIISAKDLLIEGCTLSGTSGTPPQAGIDLEPNSADEILINCMIRNCRFENNAGAGAEVYLKPLGQKTMPISITFENCIARMGGEGDSFKEVKKARLGGKCGYSIGAIEDDGPQGFVELRNCVSENTGTEGLQIHNKSNDGATVRVMNCSFCNPGTSGALKNVKRCAPVRIALDNSKSIHSFGGIEFENCHIYDTLDRPALIVQESKSTLGIRNLKGMITVHTPFDACAEMGTNTQSVLLKVVKAVQ